MIISAQNLSRFYKVHKKKSGLANSIKSLFKREYKTVKAVENISFKIEKGELVGFIGPNGAGKTTTLKCLSGLLYPTGGKVEVLGYNPWNRKHQFLKNISLVMGQKNQLWWDLPPIETFILNKEIYELKDDEYDASLDELVDLLDVGDILGVQTRKLSLGQRMKCELIAALLHSPDVLFLDEPTIGLDIVAQKKIRDFVKTYNKKRQSTIILTSHYMGDVKELCDRVIMIDKGKIIYDGLLEEISNRLSDYKLIKVVFSENVDRSRLAKVGEIEMFNPPQVELKIKREVSNSACAQLLQSFPVEDLNIEEPPIETIIRRLFDKESSANE